MTPAELKSAQRALGLSDQALARMLQLGREGDGGAGGKTVRRWKSGESNIPGPVAVLLMLALNSTEVREMLDLRRELANA